MRNYHEIGQKEIPVFENIEAKSESNSRIAFTIVGLLITSLIIYKIYEDRKNRPTN